MKHATPIYSMILKKFYSFMSKVVAVDDLGFPASTKLAKSLFLAICSRSASRSARPTNSAFMQGEGWYISTFIADLGGFQLSKYQIRNLAFIRYTSASGIDIRRINPVLPSSNQSNILVAVVNNLAVPLSYTVQ